MYWSQVYFSKEFAKTGIVKLEYISTSHNIADTITNPLQKLKHLYLTSMLLQAQENWRCVANSHMHLSTTPLKCAPTAIRNCFEGVCHRSRMVYDDSDQILDALDTSYILVV